MVLIISNNSNKSPRTKVWGFFDDHKQLAKKNILLVYRTKDLTTLQSFWMMLSLNSKKSSTFVYENDKQLQTMAKKNKQKEIVFFNNYDGYSFDFDTIKKELEEDNDCEFSDQAVWDYISVMERDDWECMLSDLKKMAGNSKIILNGLAGTWQGKIECAQIYTDIEDAIYKITKDCDYIKVWSENGHLYIKASHHDGTHNLELKLITEKGWEIYDNWLSSNCGASLDAKNRYQVLEMIFNVNFYSKLPRYTLAG